MAPAAQAERINQEGRILGALPTVTNMLFFTNADNVLAAMQIFPVTNPWNENVSRLPLITNSDAMITQINSDTGSSHRYLSIFQEMNFALVPDNQLLVSNNFTLYPDQSDLNGGKFPYALYPTPTNMPIESWPTGTGNTLLQWQTNNNGDDRHSIIVQPGTGYIYETWMQYRLGTNWFAANGAMFNMSSNMLRLDGDTSGDAAGLPMFPALVRFDECERGMVEHACRLVVVHSRDQHIYPAIHNTSGFSGVNYPSMGQRLRLKSSFVIPANWTKEEKALALGLKKYGGLVADNSSSFFSLSITPDPRWSNTLNHLVSGGLPIANFEVVQTTGPTEGPRSPNPPVANAGADQSVSILTGAQLAGVVNFSGAPPTMQWNLYSGPGTVTFGNATVTNTTATFSTGGAYTLMLSADDGVHAVAYDAVVITVTNAIGVTIGRSGTNVNLAWVGGPSPFVVERADGLPVSSWIPVTTTSVQSVSVPMTNVTQYFRVRSQ